MEHAKLHSALISLVRQLQQEHCSSLEVREFLISPGLVRQYSFDSLPDTALFAIKHVAMSILLHPQYPIKATNLSITSQHSCYP